jgi:cell division protein ZapA
MGQVIVTVHDRPYTMQCPDGEEAHLQELAQLLDTEVQQIKRSVGAVGDIRLLVMSGLMVADRLSEAMKRIEDLESQIKTLREARNQVIARGKELEARVAERLDLAAQRIEQLSREIG